MEFSPQQNNKLNFDYYYQFLNQSTYIEQELQSFGSALSKTSIALILRDTKIKKITLKETKDIKEKVCFMMEKITNNLQRECSAIIGVTASVRKISAQMRKVIDIAKLEQQRTLHKIAEYQDQIKGNEVQIKKCQLILQEQHNKHEEQQWRKLHYIHEQKLDQYQVRGDNYLKVLKNIKEKIENHLDIYKKDQNLFANNIQETINDLKIKLTQKWQLLPHFSKESSLISQLTPFNDRIKGQLSNLQREYIKKQKQIDGFKMEQLGPIKRKLKLLQEAQMSQSRQYQMCNQLGFNDNHNVVESQVVEIINS